jgi:hypothetical protein
MFHYISIWIKRIQLGEAIRFYCFLKYFSRKTIALHRLWCVPPMKHIREVETKSKVDVSALFCTTAFEGGSNIEKEENFNVFLWIRWTDWEEKMIHAEQDSCPRCMTSYFDTSLYFRTIELCRFLLDRLTQNGMMTVNVTAFVRKLCSYGFWQYLI